MKKYEIARRIRELLGADLPGLHKLSHEETAALLTALELRLSPQSRA